MSANTSLPSILFGLQHYFIVPNNGLDPEELILNVFHLTSREMKNNKSGVTEGRRLQQYLVIVFWYSYSYLQEIWM